MPETLSILQPREPPRCSIANSLDNSAQARHLGAARIISIEQQAEDSSLLDRRMVRTQMNDDWIAAIERQPCNAGGGIGSAVAGTHTLRRFPHDPNQAQCIQCGGWFPRPSSSEEASKVNTTTPVKGQQDGQVSEGAQQVRPDNDKTRK